jgi:hypothetical protein
MNRIAIAVISPILVLFSSIVLHAQTPAPSTPTQAEHGQLASQAAGEKVAPGTTLWLVQRIAVTTSSGVTGIPAGTKVTLIEDRGEKLLVSDGSQTFEATQAQITSDVAVAQRASVSDYAAQSAVVAAWNSQIQQHEATAKAQQQQKARAGSNQDQLTGLLLRAVTNTSRPDDAALAERLANTPEAQKMRQGIAAMEEKKNHFPHFSSPSTGATPIEIKSYNSTSRSAMQSGRLRSIDDQLKEFQREGRQDAYSRQLQEERTRLIQSMLENR